MGCISRPDSGPATHTSDILDFDKPRDSKYGVQSARGFSIALVARYSRTVLHVVSRLQQNL